MAEEAQKGEKGWVHKEKKTQVPPKKPQVPPKKTQTKKGDISKDVGLGEEFFWANTISE